MFIRKRQKYDHVFIDEIQDIKPEDLKKIKSFAGHVVIAGDPDQQIYDTGSTVRQINACFSPKTENLLEVFRITKNVCKLAKLIYPKISIVEGLVAAKKNSTINVGRAEDISREYSWVIETSSQRARPGSPSAIIFHSHGEIEKFGHELTSHLSRKSGGKVPFLKRQGKEGYQDFNEEAKAAGIPFRHIGGKSKTFSESDRIPIVFITTAHSAKGLDFNNVFLPNLHPKAFRSGQAAVDDYTKRLLVVAVTRSRENLFLTYHTREPIDFVNRIPIGIANLFQINSGSSDFSRAAGPGDYGKFSKITLEKIDDGDFF
jgi:superfamily I DNA/RNA helicase